MVAKYDKGPVGLMTKWDSSAKYLIDALAYGLLTGGSFAGFWPS